MLQSPTARLPEPSPPRRSQSLFNERTSKFHLIATELQQKTAMLKEEEGERSVLAQTVALLSDQVEDKQAEIRRIKMESEQKKSQLESMRTRLKRTREAAKRSAGGFGLGGLWFFVSSFV